MEADIGEDGVERTMEADLCVVGGGPAGLVVAASLAEVGCDVVLLESASARDAAAAQGLNAGMCEGDPYDGLRRTRHRSLGGTCALWNTPAAQGVGAKYAPLDPWDFEPRWPEAPDGWPISFESLAPYYERAQRACGLGRFDYEARAWGSSGRDAPGDAEGLASRVYQFGSRAALLDPLLRSLRGAGGARLYTGATVTALSVARTGCTVRVAGASGRQHSIRARRVVLAAGAIENARLLLVAAAAGQGVSDRSGWLGCGFMEHPRDRTLALQLPSRDAWRALAFLDAHTAVGGGRIAGRLALATDAARAAGRDGPLLNASATLLPIVRPWRERARALLARGRPLRPLERWLPAGGYGWSTHPAPERVFAGLQLLLNVEQPPHRDNAIVLGSRVDAHAVPLPVLRWRWNAEDHGRLIRLREHFARGLERFGAGRVTIGPDIPPDPNAHHHAGTTRMHDDPRHGVVDADGRVHGTDSLFVVGASTFPTAGFANPTLTIVAMALRLADRLHAESTA